MLKPNNRQKVQPIGPLFFERMQSFHQQIRRGLPLLFLLGLWELQAQFQSIGYPQVFNHFKTTYHAGTQNWAIQQDPDGVLYVGNNKGLLEFDGATWRLHPLPNRTIVRSLAFGQDGRLYLGSQNDLGYMEFAGNSQRIYHSLVNLIPEKFRNFEDVWKIIPVGDALFFCSQKAVFLFQNEEIRVFEPETRFEAFFECNGEIFIQDNRFRLYKWTGDSFKPYLPEDRLKGIKIIGILPHSGQRLALISEANGLFLMDQSRVLPWETPAARFLAANRAYCAIQLADGRFAVGTSLKGLIILDQEGAPEAHYHTLTGLQNNTVLTVFQDQHQNLWLGLDNGIDYLAVHAPFTLIRSNMGVEGAGYASRVFKDQLYLGTNQGLYVRDIRRKTNPLAGEGFREVENVRGQVWTIDRLGDELLIGQHEGAFSIRETTSQATLLSDQKGAWKFLELNRHPGFALEGVYSGLVLLARSRVAGASGNPDWVVVRRLTGFDESARVMEEDEAGDIWISHAYKGVFKVSLSDDAQSIRSVHFYDATKGLPSNISINVAKIGGEVVFTTPAGVYYYNRQVDRIEKHPELNDILGHNRNIHRLIADETGNIWFSVDQEFGVLKVNKKGIFNKVEKQFFNHIYPELMEGYEQVFATDSNHVFIATEKGFIQYRPDKDNTRRSSFKTLIRRILLTTRKDSLIFYRPSSTVPENEDTPQRFYPELNDFIFSFSAPFYEQGQFIHYRYKLEGFQNEWSDWTTKTEKEYNNLPHGDYRFVVEARNAYGQTGAPAFFSFVIETPWFITTAAKIGYFLVGVLFMVGLYRFFAKKLARETSVLKQEQAHLLQQKEAQFQQEAEKSGAEIMQLRNEKLQADITLKNSKLASATMHLVQKGEILLKIKEELNKLLPNTKPDNRMKIKQVIQSIDENIRQDNHWEEFELYFDQVHEDFLKRLRELYPTLTPKDQKLCAYLRMNLSTKEVAPLMNISVRGVEIGRYRLRKKLNIDSDTNLVDFIIRI